MKNEAACLLEAAEVIIVSWVKRKEIWKQPNLQQNELKYQNFEEKIVTAQEQGAMVRGSLIVVSSHSVQLVCPNPSHQ